MVEVREISKEFGTVRAVDGVSFTAQPGEILGLLGPNGAGKSTIIRIIMNILGPDQGEVFFEGHPIREEDKDHIGYLPEERGLYRKVKVGDMLLYLARLKGLDSGAAERGVQRWLERFSLSQWRERKVDELSKGMAQKIQLAATLIHDPRFVFLDEPFAGLDPVSTDLLRDVVLEMERAGRTIVLSTHNMEEAERMCHRVFIVSHGREVVSGTLSEVKRRFGKDTVVVEFDGDASFLDEVPFVTDLVRYPRRVEMRLRAGSTTDELLRLLVPRLSVRRFQVVSPSLRQIFVAQVGREEGGGR